MEIFSIGFTQTTAAHFFGRLKQHEIGRLMDVRLHPGSQLSGFAKDRDLPYFLRELVGAEYVHEPLLTPTDDILKDFKRRNALPWDEYERRFVRPAARKARRGAARSHGVRRPNRAALLRGDCRALPSPAGARIPARSLGQNRDRSSVAGPGDRWAKLRRRVDGTNACARELSQGWRALSRGPLTLPRCLGAPGVAPWGRGVGGRAVRRWRPHAAAAGDRDVRARRAAGGSSTARECDRDGRSMGERRHGRGSVSRARRCTGSGRRTHRCWSTTAMPFRSTSLPKASMPRSRWWRPHSCGSAMARRSITTPTSRAWCSGGVVASGTSRSRTSR